MLMHSFKAKCFEHVRPLHENKRGGFFTRIQPYDPAGQGLDYVLAYAMKSFVGPNGFLTDGELDRDMKCDVRLDEATISRLNDIAKQAGVSRAFLIRKAIRLYLAGRKR